MASKKKKKKATKKSKVKEVKGELLPAVKASSPAVEVAAEIDFKITKSDIIDMAIAEADEQLEGQIKVAQKAVDSSVKKRDALWKQLKKKAQTAAETQYKTKTNKDFKKGTIWPPASSPLSALIKIKSQRVTTDLQHNPEWPDSYYGRRDNAIKLTATVEIEYQHKNRHDNYYGSNLWIKKLDFINFTSVKKDISVYKQQRKLTQSKEKALYELHTKQADLKKMGKRAKAAIIRRMLSTTQQGQSILKSIKSQKDLAQLLLKG